MQDVKAKYPHINIVISVGGWGADGFSEAASTDDKRAVFAKSIALFVRKHGFDGVDLDWEYPCIDVAGIEARKEDRTNFTKLLEAVRAELDELEKVESRKLMMTIAVGAGDWFVDVVEIAKIEPLLDYMYVMTYDFFNGGCHRTDHHTNLYEGDKTRNSVVQSIELFYHAGVPKNKLVIGAGFYGRGFQKVASSENNGLYEQGEGAFSISFEQIMDQYTKENGFKRYWDDKAKAAYLFNGSTFISYDDEKSTYLKGEYVRVNKLAGAMFWEYGQDRTGRLLRSLRKGILG
ncbi:chitinase [Halalkalibacter hemicellulosilyticusJCM 9152]|uniref:chitinase n=1 Tax=Halalkalibacter hemicellulosilyticusJCM 9152 TaxID=1236971 RepID=W4QMG8_9BACI|nr:chitinase [Halalkalibacter hemicellulosilyticusJCM 9152]